MSDWRGYVVLLIGIGVPLVLLLHRREQELFAWLCITVGINIFDARVGINFAAARLVGLVVLPFLPLGAFEFQRLLNTRPMRLLLAGLGYLALLGIIYGFVYPWPNEGYLRPFVQTSPGRVMVYAVRLLADLGIALLVARRMMRGTRPDEVLRLVLIGTSIAVVGGLAEFVTKVQLYQLFTGFPINEIPGRVRGLNFEPRGLGLTMVQGGFIAFLWARYRRSRAVMALAAAHFVVLALAVSASALVTAAVGWLALMIFEPRARRPLVGFGVVAAGLGAVLVLMGKDLPLAASWVANLSARFTARQAFDLATQTPVEILARFLDIFDYTAVMAFAAYPWAMVIGFGPGLVMLPGSKFIPDDPRWSWVVTTNEGITSPPTMGLLLEWSNGGVVMLLLWLALVVSCTKALSAMATHDPEHADAWLLGRGAFVVVAATYLVQANPIAAIWPIFIGLGLGAAACAPQTVRSWSRGPAIAPEAMA